MDKLDLKKELKKLYSGKKGVFDIIEVQPMKYLQIHGSGDPNTSPEYSKSVEALFSIAYSIKFLCKKADRDFVVMPLEGLWYAEDKGVFQSREKDKWNWTMLILMPDFVDEEIFKEAFASVKKKKDNPKIDEVFFEEISEGVSVQTLHIGSYDDETEVIAAMHKYVIESGYKLRGKHHEIYLSDPRKISPDKLKTILRQPIEII